MVALDRDDETNHSRPARQGDGSGVHNCMARREKNPSRGGKARGSKVREHIELAPINLPFDELLKRLLKVEPDKITALVDDINFKEAL